MNNDKLTFEDWKNGKIPFPPPRYDKRTEEYKSNHFLEEIGLWPRYWALWHEPSKMEDAELVKIEEEQERVFERLVGYTVRCKVIFLERVMEDMTLEEQSSYQQNEKEKIKEKLNNDRDNKSKMMRGLIPRKDLDNYTCELILMTIRMFEEVEETGGILMGSEAYLCAYHLSSLYKTYVDARYLNELNPEEMLAANKIDKLIKTFVWEKFEPKTHDKQMIEDYLIRWEQNQGLGYPRKTTVDELKSDYPKLGKIYNSSSSVIFNWEERWKKYKDARTEK